MGQIDDAHHAEHDGQAGADQHQKGHRVDDLDCYDDYQIHFPDLSAACRSISTCA
jgi:hypothetical protein